VKKCGATTCFDILNMLVGKKWSIGSNLTFAKLMKFYNTVFVPRSARITSIAKDTLRPTLPDVKRYSTYSESILIGLHGAELYVPIFNKLIIIKGYFK